MFYQQEGGRPALPNDVSHTETDSYPIVVEAASLAVILAQTCCQRFRKSDALLAISDMTVTWNMCFCIQKAREHRLKIIAFFSLI